MKPISEEQIRKELELFTDYELSDNGKEKLLNLLMAKGWVIPENKSALEEAREAKESYKKRYEARQKAIEEIAPRKESVLLEEAREYYKAITNEGKPAGYFRLSELYEKAIEEIKTGK